MACAVASASNTKSHSKLVGCDIGVEVSFSVSFSKAIYYFFDNTKGMFFPNNSVKDAAICANRLTDLL